MVSIHPKRTNRDHQTTALFPSPPVFFFQFFGNCTKSFNLKLVWPSLLCSTFFFQFPSKVQVFTFLFAFFQFHSVVNRDCKVHNPASSLCLSFLFVITKSARLSENSWSVCISKSQSSFCVSYSNTGVGFCINPLFQFSVSCTIPSWSHSPTQPRSYVVLFSLCASLLFSLIWLIVSSLSQRNLHLLFYWV